MDPPPTVVFGFNRPNRLSQVLEALRPQEPAQLIVVLDGPRDQRDEPAVEQCRQVATAIDWAPTTRLFHRRNRGCAGLLDDIDEILSRHPAAIFVEDDCLPMPSFLGWMGEALERYRGDDRIFSIGGHQLLPRQALRRFPAAIASWRFDCWGWASWSDRWQRIRPALAGFPSLFDDLRRIPDLVGPDFHSLARACADGKVDTWDIKVAVACLSQGMFHLTPRRGLIRNTGLGLGTHTAAVPPLFHNRNVHRRPIPRFDFPDPVEVDEAFSHKLELYIRRGLGRRRMLSRVRRLVAPN